MTRPVRIPSDINRPDRVVGPFTARQAAILAGTGAVLYLAWTVVRPPCRGPAVPGRRGTGGRGRGGHRARPPRRAVDGPAAGRRDTPSPHPTRPTNPPPRHVGSERVGRCALDRAGAGLDWLPHHRRPQRRPRPQPAAGRGRRPPGLPARTVTAVPGGRGPGRVGVVDLGPDGLVVIALVSTVNFALRTPAEQDGLVAGFARYLHALGGPVQILIRALPVDLHTHLHQLRTQLQHLPHPALAAAAHDHLTHLARLAHQDGDNQLLTRHVLLVLREPHRPATTATAPDRRPRERPEPGGREPGITAGEHRLLAPPARRDHPAGRHRRLGHRPGRRAHHRRTHRHLQPRPASTPAAGPPTVSSAEAPATSDNHAPRQRRRPADHRSRSRPDPQRPRRERPARRVPGVRHGRPRSGPRRARRPHPRRLDDDDEVDDYSDDRLRRLRRRRRRRVRRRGRSWRPRLPR